MYASKIIVVVFYSSSSTSFYFSLFTPFQMAILYEVKVSKISFKHYSVLLLFNKEQIRERVEKIKLYYNMYYVC